MIRYKKYQAEIAMGSRKGERLWYARAVSDGTVDLDGLAEHMSQHNTPYSSGTIHGVLRDMVACIKELLLDGKKVKLADLAIFWASLSCRGAESAEAFTVSRHVRAVRLRTLATGELATGRLTLEGQLREADEYVRPSAEASSGGEASGDSSAGGGNADTGI